MAERSGRLIFPDFFGTKAGVTTGSSLVNTTSPLEPGETIFEKDTGQFRTNLTASTLPYSQSGYTGNAIRFSTLAELRAYDYPFDYQLVHTITPQSFFYYDPTDTTSTDNNSTLIVSNGGKRYKFWSQPTTLPSNSFTGDLTLTGSLISPTGSIDNLTTSNLVVSKDITLSGSLIDSHSLAFYGAVGDGVTDDTLAIQAAINAFTSSNLSGFMNQGGGADLGGGGTIFAEPKKSYLIGGTLDLGPSVTLDLQQSFIYMTSSNHAVRLRPNSYIKNGTILISESLDYDGYSAIYLDGTTDSNNIGDDFFQNIRNPNETTAGIYNMNLRGPAIYSGGASPSGSDRLYHAKGDGILLQVLSASRDSNDKVRSGDITGTRFSEFNIIGFRTAIHLSASNATGTTGSVPFVNSNQFHNFGIKGCVNGIHLETDTQVQQEVSNSVGISTNFQRRTQINQNKFDNFYIQPVGAKDNSRTAIVNNGQKNWFTNFTIWDWQAKNLNTGSIYFNQLVYNTPNGFILNGDAGLPTAPLIVDNSGFAGNYYNGGFNMASVLDRSTFGSNTYISNVGQDSNTPSTIIEKRNILPTNFRGSMLGDTTDYLSFAWERGLNISQSRYPDISSGSRYGSNLTASISTVFEPYSAGYIKYNSLTTPVTIEIDIKEDELNSFIRGNTILDNQYFKGAGIKFRHPDTLGTASNNAPITDYPYVPEHVKIEVFRSGSTGLLSSSIARIDSNKDTFVGYFGPKATTTEVAKGYTKLRFTLSSSAANDCPVLVERISMMMGSDDSKTYIKRSDDYYYGGLEFKPVYGRNADGTVDTSNVLREASLTISGSSLITNDLTVEGRILDSQSLAFWGAVGDGITDDTIAIQNALNSNTASAQVLSNDVANLTGGTVIYGEPGKTYLIGDTVIVPTNVRFDLNQSRIYVTSSHDAVRLKPWSKLENGTILISESLDYTDKSAVLLLASASSTEAADGFFPSIRRLYETTAGIRNINLRGPGLVPTGGITGSIEAKLTGNAIRLKAESNEFDLGPNINATKFNDFEVIGFKYGIHIEAINSFGTGSAPFISNNQFSNFGFKNNAYGIYIYTNASPGTEISESAGFSSGDKLGGLVSSNVFTDFWFNPVKTTYAANNAIVNYGEKNLFDNFFIIDYKNAFTGSVADGGSPFKSSSPQFFSPSNGNRLNAAALNENDFVPSAIVDLNPQGGNVYNGEFSLTHVQDRSYTGFNKYNSTRFDEFLMASPVDHGVTLPPYHLKGLPVGDQNDYLAFAYERGFGISQSRYPDSVTGSRYDDISQGISTVFEPYGNGFVRYNSVTSSVELTISFPQEEFNSYIREFSKLSLSDYYNRSDNRFFKGLGVRFKEQTEFTTSSVDDYYQTPEHVKISVIQRNRSGGFVSENTIYEYNDNKTLFLGDVGKKAFEAGTNGGYWDVKVMFSSSADQDNPVVLERISCWLGTDDNKAYIKRSDDYYYGGLEFKPVYGRNTDGTVDTSNIIREASLTVSGSITSTEKQIISGSSYLVPALAQGNSGETIYLTGSTYNSTSIVKAVHDRGSNGTLTLVLPHSSGSNEVNRTIRIISNGSTDNTHKINIIPITSDTLDGGTGGFEINRAYEGLMCWSDGTEWFRIQSKG